MYWAQPRSVNGGFAIGEERADVEILTPAAIDDRFGRNVVEADGAPLALMRLLVADIDATCGARS